MDNYFRTIIVYVWCLLTLGSSQDIDKKCIPLKNCPYGMHLVNTEKYAPSTIEFLRNSHCGHTDADGPLIWCPMSAQPASEADKSSEEFTFSPSKALKLSAASNPSEVFIPPKCTTTAGKPGTCKVLAECDVILNTNLILSDLKTCSSKDKFSEETTLKVCCPERDIRGFSLQKPPNSPVVVILAEDSTLQEVTQTPEGNFLNNNNNDQQSAKTDIIVDKTNINKTEKEKIDEMFDSFLEDMNKHTESSDQIYFGLFENSTTIPTQDFSNASGKWDSTHKIDENVKTENRFSKGHPGRADHTHFIHLIEENEKHPTTTTQSTIFATEKRKAKSRSEFVNIRQYVTKKVDAVDTSNTGAQESSGFRNILNSKNRQAERLNPRKRGGFRHISISPKPALEERKPGFIDVQKIQKNRKSYTPPVKTRSIVFDSTKRSSPDDGKLNVSKLVLRNNFKEDTESQADLMPEMIRSNFNKQSINEDGTRLSSRLGNINGGIRVIRSPKSKGSKRCKYGKLDGVDLDTIVDNQNLKVEQKRENEKFTFANPQMFLRKPNQFYRRPPYRFDNRNFQEYYHGMGNNEFGGAFPQQPSKNFDYGTTPAPNNFDVEIINSGNFPDNHNPSEKFYFGPYPKPNRNLHDYHPGGYFPPNFPYPNNNVDVFMEPDFPEMNRPRPNLGPRNNFFACGREARKESSRIIGGIPVALGEYPWMVLIQYKGHNGIVNGCGGSLINSQYVLTAAHCLDSTILKLRNLELYRIILGEYDTNRDPDCLSQPENRVCAEPFRIFGVSSVTPHPDFDRVTALNDVALIKLDKEVIFSEYIKPICLPYNGFEFQSNESIVVAGWGRTQVGGTFSHTLNKAELPMVDKEVCTRRGVILNDGQVCLGLGNGVDTCTGDSGGPMMIQRMENSDVVTYQFGIISYGFATEDCGKAPSVNTYIPFYLEWISNVIQARENRQ